ncbi:hypothetical protein AB0L74_02125 [Streptomyces sp. NPDC052020]|uniref:hypothetical protein n=1 Tax=Streptomyces sp. NPDC052020 TaxID=3155677 RepID=UPI0034393738
MTTLGPGGGDPPGEPEGTTPHVPDEVWQKFLADSEDAIRDSAPREPSARDRVPGGWPGPLPDAAGVVRGSEGPYGNNHRCISYGGLDYGSCGGQAHAVAGAGDPVAGAVGDLWQPDDPGSGPGWRELDRRARLQRVGRVAGTAAAVVLAVAVWSLVPAGPGAPGGGPGPSTVQQLEDAPRELPAATARPAGAGDARCAPTVSWSSPSRRPEPWSCG